MLAQGFCHLLRLTLPSATVRLSDGAEIKWGADIYRPRHASYGGIGSVEALAEGIGDEVPALQIELLVPGSTAAATLLAPGLQTSRVTAWLAEANFSTSTVVGTPSAVFDGWIDQGRLVRSAGSLALNLSVVSLLERLFELNTGNTLSPSWHKSVWPGETGEDHATGLGLADAWGVEAPPAAVVYASGAQGGSALGAIGRSWVDR